MSVGELRQGGPWVTFFGLFWPVLWLPRRSDVARCVAVTQFQSPVSFILKWDFAVLLRVV